VATLGVTANPYLSGRSLRSGLECETVAQLLRSTLQTGASLGTIAAHSYCHSNGFSKLRIAPQEALHMWHSGDGQSCVPNVHTHRGAFSSTLLAGTIEIEHFVDASGDQFQDVSMEEYEYLPDDRGEGGLGAYSLSYVGLRWLRRYELRRLKAGDRHVVLPSRLHRVTCVSRETGALTRVKYAERTASSTRVLTERVVPAAIERTPMSIDDARRLLSQALCMIGG